MCKLPQEDVQLPATRWGMGTSYCAKNWNWPKLTKIYPEFPFQQAPGFQNSYTTQILLRTVSRWGIILLMLPSLPSSQNLFLNHYFLNVWDHVAEVSPRRLCGYRGCRKLLIPQHPSPCGGGTVPSLNHNPLPGRVPSTPHGKMERVLKPWGAGTMRYSDLFRSSCLKREIVCCFMCLTTIFP